MKISCFQQREGGKIHQLGAESEPGDSGQAAPVHDIQGGRAWIHKVHRLHGQQGKHGEQRDQQ